MSEMMYDQWYDLMRGDDDRHWQEPFEPGYDPGPDRSWEAYQDIAYAVARDHGETAARAVDTLYSDEDTWCNGDDLDICDALEAAGLDEDTAYAIATRIVKYRH